MNGADPCTLHQLLLCVPPLADAGVTYRAMHDALAQPWLPRERAAAAGYRAPSWQPPAIDHLAMRCRAAAHRPFVCVLRAQDVPVAAGLTSSDAVMRCSTTVPPK